MKELQKINVLSVAKVFALFGVLSGIFYGISAAIQSVKSPISFADAWSYSLEDPTLAPYAISVAFGCFAIIVSPIIFGIIQFVTGVLLTFIYNLFAKYFGGIRVELD